MICGWAKLLTGTCSVCSCRQVHKQPNSRHCPSRPTIGLHHQCKTIHLDTGTDGAPALPL